MQIMAGIEVLDDDIETAALADVLPADLAHRVAAPLTEFGLLTPEDLYECAANVGGNWYRQLQGLSREERCSGPRRNHRALLSAGRST